MKQEFDRLFRPKQEGGIPTFSVERIGEEPLVLLGRSSTGDPALLVETEGEVLDPIELRNLRCYFAPRCRIEFDGRTEERRLSVVECRADDPELRTYFLEAMKVVVEVSMQTGENVVSGLATLVELFREMSHPPRSTIVGLWGELFVLDESEDVVKLVSAWHDTVDQRFDLAFDDVRIEIKTTSNDLRRHEFSHDQLRTNAPLRTFVVSVMTLASPAGVSISTLRDSVLSRLQGYPDLAEKVIKLVAAALGRDWRNGLSETYELGIAKQSARIYRSNIIPAVSGPIPPEIHSVRYQVDLTEVEAYVQPKVGDWVIPRQMSSDPPNSGVN